jgi:predicted dehydrogenase
MHDVPMHVPELRTANRRADRAAAAQWREERRALREEGHDVQPLQLALVTDGSDSGLAASVRAGGADVVGLLAPNALESLVWAAEAQADHGYAALDVLAADAVDAACLDLPVGEACRVAGVLLADGLSVVLARPELPDRSQVRALLDAAGTGNATATLGLRSRGWQTIAHAERLAAELGPLSQLTVLGWPVGRAARAELIDVVRRLTGDLVAVCASAAEMPAPELAPDAPVSLSMLSASGTTVIASETPRASYGGAQLTLIGSHGRLVAGQRRVVVADPQGVRENPVGVPEDPVQVATAGLRDELAGWPHHAATLGDALAAARIMELAARSYEHDTWVEA